MLKKLWPYS